MGNVVDHRADTTDLDPCSLGRLREVAEYFSNHNPPAAIELLKEIVQTVAASSVVAKPAMIRFELTCRGCGKTFFNQTETIEVRAGHAAPTLVLRGSVNPHRCLTERRGLF